MKSEQRSTPSGHGKRRRQKPQVYWFGGIGFAGPGAKRLRDKWEKDTRKAMGLK